MIEATAAILGFFCTWYSLRQNILTWPSGIISVVLYTVLFFQVRLYADMGLQVIYCVLMFYGWRNWQQENKIELPVRKVSTTTIMILTLIGGVAWIVLYYLLAKYTNSQCVAFDAFNAVASLIATWLMAKKYIETWFLWFITDSSYVGIYLYKHLYLTSALYAFYTILAMLGYYWWFKSWRQTQIAYA